MFTKLLEALKATRRTIVFTEGPDARILEATDRLLKEDLMDVILIGNEAEVKAAAEKGNFCICKATIIDPATYEGMDEMVAKMVELRKGKMSEEECRAALSKGNYFDYHNKYAPDGAQEICPAPIAPEETAKVQDAALAQSGRVMTYEYYHNVIKGNAPKNAPTYQAPEKTQEEGYICTVCGYFHKGELPPDFKCPVCGVPAEKFKKAP